MIRMKIGKAVCKGLIEGKNFVEIAKDIGVTDVYVKKMVARLIDEGVVKRRNRFDVRADYEELFYEESKKR